MKNKSFPIHLFIIITLSVFYTQSTILISSPAINPFDNSEVPYSYANIGSIPYGKTLSFDLI